MKKVCLPIAIMISITLCMCMPMGVFAGSINAEEQSVINYCSGTFKYKGKTYQATASALAALRAKMAEDGVDLDAGQASAAKSEFLSNFAQGIEQGYLVEVNTGGSTNPPGTEEPDNDIPVNEEEPDVKPEEGTPEPPTDSQNKKTNNKEKDVKKVKEILKEVVEGESGSYKVTGSSGGKNDQVLDLASDDILGQLVNVSDIYTIESYGQGMVSVMTKEGDLLFGGDMPIKNTGLHIDDSWKVAGLIILSVLSITLGAGIFLVLKEKKEGYLNEQKK